MIAVKLNKHRPARKASILPRVSAGRLQGASVPGRSMPSWLHDL